jgi:signal transduction histidine kinase
MKNLPGQNAADLSHEMRNRLTYIMLASNALCLELQTVLSDEQRQQFCKIDIAAEELRGLLNNLTALWLTEVTESRINHEETALLIGG